MPTMPRVTLGLLGLCGSLMATGAVAQDTDDWDFLVDPAKDLTVAGVEFGGGVSLAVQCQGGALSMIVGGAPLSTAPIRAVSLTRDNEPSRRSYLNPIEGSSLWKSGDARAVRWLRRGGKITIASIPGQPHPMRMQIDLPGQSANVDRVLTACGYPLADSRDELADASGMLAARPRLEMPPFPHRYTIVRVELSCIISNSRLTACQSDHETPSAPEVGAATARRANGARVTLNDGVNADGTLLEVVVTGNRIYR